MPAPPPLRATGAYLLYCLAAGASCVALLSVASFFHFLLDHDLATIEDWVFDHAWEIGSGAKLAGLAALVAVLGVKSGRRTPFRDLVLGRPGEPAREVLVAVTALFILTVVLMNPAHGGNHRGGLAPAAASFVGTYVFYMSDVAALLFADGVLGGGRGAGGGGPARVPWEAPVLAGAHLALGRWLLPFSRGVDAAVFCNALALFFLARWRGGGWANPSLHCLLLACPLAALTPLNPLWGGHHAVLSPAGPWAPAALLPPTLLCLGYLHAKEGRARGRRG